MNILTVNQYNQGISKGKLLSSTSGVGSIITTKAGYYILISDINKWKFVRNAQKEIQKIREDVADEIEQHTKARKRIRDLGIDVLDDPRFVEFLKQEKQLERLLCLIAIPHLSLNEHFNTVNVSNNPTIQELKKRGESVTAENFMALGTHFPKWFKNRKGELHEYSVWTDRWKSANNKMKFFAPPRDAKDPIRGANKTPISKKVKDSDGIEEEIILYHQLTQLNLILICPHGHLSDIPWSKFLKWKTDRSNPTDRGHDLLTSDPCCPSPNLRWTESTTKSEGYSSIYLECKNCLKKENLEGINNLSPYCLSEKPWELEVDDKNSLVPRDQRCLKDRDQRQEMQTALVTGNNVYYSNGFSSLYIPLQLIDGVDERITTTVREYEEKYIRYLEFSEDTAKADFFAQFMTKEKLLSDGYREYVLAIQDFRKQLEALFLDEKQEVIEDTHEHYRWQEYQCFKNNTCSGEGLQDFAFKDISLPEKLQPYFDKIQQVEELKVCQVQLDFTRVKPNERVIRENEIENSTEGQNIFSIAKEELLTLPANENYGEGIFFGFDGGSISNWYQTFQELLDKRLTGLIGAYHENSHGAGARQRITRDGFNGVKFLLIHSFSHIIMRELEFSCGYPTASLKERLFISERMSGVLVYTTEGAEGSMGGLVWQGQSDKIEELIKNGLHRAEDCSSDPLCWESDGQGLFNLNLAACFSCSLISETACEEWNLGLDRRVLIDGNFGFFKNLL